MDSFSHLTSSAQVRITVERHETYRRLINAVVGVLAILLVSATVSWVGINYIAGCGAIDPITRTANLDACILYPATKP